MKEAFCTNCRCKLCNDEIALSLRLFGKSAAQLLCTGCAAKHHGCDKEFIVHKINILKQTGCELFNRKYVN